MSLMSGMMMGMGGMGMGGMGMGGMGMGGMGMGGGMGGGFRSIPPTSLPFAILRPGQTRHLPTRLVGLSEPNPENPVTLPEKGEKLTLGDISQVTDNARVQKALKRLAADKAPSPVAQLVIWRVASGGLEWDAIAAMSKDWANDSGAGPGPRVRQPARATCPRASRRRCSVRSVPLTRRCRAWRTRSAWS